MGRNVEIPDDMHSKLRKMSEQTGIKIKMLVARAIAALLAKKAA